MNVNKLNSRAKGDTGRLLSRERDLFYLPCSLWWRSMMPLSEKQATEFHSQIKRLWVLLLESPVSVSKVGAQINQILDKYTRPDSNGYHGFLLFENWRKMWSDKKFLAWGLYGGDIYPHPKVRALHEMLKSMIQFVMDRKTEQAKQNRIQKLCQAIDDYATENDLSFPSFSNDIEDPGYGDTYKAQIIKALYIGGAFSSDYLMRCADIARVIDTGMDPDCLKRPISALSKNGHVKSKSGPGGGTWLTPEGKQLAEQRYGMSINQ